MTRCLRFSTSGMLLLVLKEDDAWLGTGEGLRDGILDGMDLRDGGIDGAVDIGPSDVVLVEAAVVFDDLRLWGVRPTDEGIFV